MLNIRTTAFLAWVAIVVVILLIMPDLDKLVREKGQLEVPATAESMLANELLIELNNGVGNTFDLALVFHDEEGLSDSQVAEIDGIVTNLIDNQKALGIEKFLAHTESEQAAKQLVAEDGTTILTQISINQDQGQIQEITDAMYGKIAISDVETYITGAAVVSNDFSSSTQEGVAKTEVIAVIFILLVLIVIFRSPIIPVISLLTVGVSYIVSLGIVALLVEHYNMPFSNFTQVFLVVILFGIGTDYNILLFTRFKEELVANGHVLKAIATTYKTAGKTVIFSGLAVLIGFIALFFAEFKMYQATAPVAVGVAVLLLVLLTLNPFFMGILGFKLFWPIKKIDGHGENKFWGALSKKAYFHPLLAVLLMAVIFIPSAMKYSGELNFNDLNEIDDEYLSKQAITIIEEHYLPGFSSPISFVIEANESLATQENLQELDAITAAIQQVDGVAEVYSVTRPEGKRIEDLYSNKQSETLNSGLTDAESGVSDISSGLNEATDALKQPQDLSGVQELINGTNSLQGGAQQLQQALGQLQAGLTDGTEGAKALLDGLSSLEQNLQPLVTGVDTLATAYGQLQGGFSQFSDYINGTLSTVTQAKAGYEQIRQSMQALVASNASLEEDANVKTVLDVSAQAIQNLTTMETQAKQVATQYASTLASFQSANNSLADVQAGLAQVQDGVSKLKAGAETLASGLETAENGTSTLANESGQFVSGLAQVNDGQKELQSSLTDLQEQLGTLSEGLTEGSEGLKQIQEGLQDANGYLNELSKNESGTFYIPQEVLEGEDFATSIDRYMSDDRTLSSMTIILDVNPFTAEAMEIGKAIRETVASSLAVSDLKEATAFTGGKTMTNIDLQKIASDDFIRSAVIMLIGISVVLLLITKSLFQTLVTVASLVITTFAALGLAELVNEFAIGQEFLSWNVPFFSFIMIVALGVDYSIFLLMRFNEYPELGTAGIIPAAKQMGSVVISAAVILGGTFAALMPSGILSLIQIALVVIIGLIMLSCIMMPAFLPAMLGLRERFIHFEWKFKKKK